MAFPATPLDGQIYTTTDGREYVYSLAADTWNYQGIQSTAPLVNTNAAVPPTATDDISAGYKPSSLWVDTAAQKAYVNVSNTAGAAVWKVLDAGIKVQASAPIAPVTGEMYLNTTDGFVYVWNGTAWVDVTAAGATIKDNFTAATAPIAGNDSTQGYSVGSRWINTVAGIEYSCVSAAVGAAVWHTAQEPDRVVAGGGVANVYTGTTVAPAAPVTTLRNGLTVIWGGAPAAATNTGVSTFNLDGTGAFPILFDGTLTPITAGTLVANGGATILYYANGNWYISNTNAIGKGQTWQNVTATRLAGVAYTNTTGRSIAVSISALSTGTGSTPTITVGGVVISGVEAPSALTASSVSCIVPAGASYTFTFTLLGTISTWSELR